MKVSFYCRKSKSNKDGKAPIYAKIKIEGKTKLKSVGVSCFYKDWVSEHNLIVNDPLSTQKILQFQIELSKKYNTVEYLNEGKTIELEDLEDAPRSKRMRLEKAFIEFSHFDMEDVKTSSTEKNKRNQLKYLGRFVEEYKVKYVDGLNRHFPKHYINYLQSLYDLMDSTLNAHNKCINRFCKWLNKELLHTADLSDTVIRPQITSNINYLKSEELDVLRKKDFVSKALNRVRDMFLFAVNTGLSFSDLFKIERSDIKKSIDDQYYIDINRQKTSQNCFIPLTPEAKNILEMYEYKLPVISNQKYNRYLKECFEIVGITRRITSHVARKTCGTQLLNMGLSYDLVAKILGHSSSKITRDYYARYMPETVLREYNANLKATRQL